MTNGPCSWPNAGCPACDGFDCLSKVQREDIESWAAFDLWAATGRIYGTCEVTVMPCGDPWVLCGVCWDNLRACGCRRVPEVKLPGPVHSVIEVVVDGEVLDDTAYRIDDYQWLVRLDGGSWPNSADPLDPDSFQVTFLQGIEPPPGAGTVIGILACSRAGCTNGTCKVPKRARQVTRQGVTMVLAEGSFGIPEVDDWVRNVNTPMFAGAVHSPDIPTVRRTTWQSVGSP